MSVHITKTYNIGGLIGLRQNAVKNAGETLGFPIVGFDVRYGNQTFIDDGQNGYKIPITDEMDQKEKIKLLSERIVRMFTEDDMDAFSGHSYEKAKEYLTKEVVHRWIELLK